MNLDELLRTERATVDVETAAGLLGISRGVGYAAHRDGSLPGALTLGRRRLVSVVALRRALGAGDAESSSVMQASGGNGRPLKESITIRELIHVTR